MRRAKPARPEWALRLERLREALGLSQAGLARQLDVSPMATSRWERGINQPNAAIYLELGKLAGAPDCWYFWERAGLKKSDVASATGTGAKRQRQARPALESVPVFATKAKMGAGGIPTLMAVPIHGTSPEMGTDAHTEILRDAALEFVVAPRSWCPHPDMTIALRMGDNSMAPILRTGCIVAVDEMDRDPAMLRDKFVLAMHEQHGLMVRCLQQIGHSQVLVPENRDVPPTYIQNADWKIVGRVLWWFAMAS